MEVSLISSFYRVQAHLPQFVERARVVAEEVRAAGLSLELVIVANDAQLDERRIIDTFAASVPDVRVLYVERESLYASWNRGITAASGQMIGFWNADDTRTPAGIIEGVHRIRDGCDLVYFTFTVDRAGHQRIYHAIPFDREAHTRRMAASPFFMFRRTLYERVGPFDGRFRVVGDWEWIVRALNHTEFCSSAVNAGTFYLHGDNLSNVGDTRELVESNIIRLMLRRYSELTPAPPDPLRAAVSEWASDIPSVPAEVETKLWGEGAQAAWEHWQIEEPRRKTAAHRRERIRAVPKWLIDRLGLRPLLARLGLVKARRRA